MTETTNDVVINARANVAEAVYDLRRLQNEVNKGARVSFKTLAVQQEQAAQAQTKLNKVLGKTPFAGWALSIMFAGMALKQMSMSVARFGVKAFQDISHSVEGTVTQSDYLNASMTYMGFVIGQALEPVLAWLVPIVDKISDWVNEHPKLTAALVTSGIVLGGLLMLWGGLKLAINGVSDAYNLTKLVFGKLASALSSMPGLTWASALRVALAVGIVAGIIAVLVWIYKLQDAIGGWGEFFKSVVRGILRVLVILISAVSGVVAEIKNAFDWVWNEIVAGVEWFVNKVIAGVNLIIKAINKVRGEDNQIDLVPKVDFGGATAEVKKFGQSFMETYGNMMESYVDWEEKYLAPEKGYAEMGGLLPKYAEDAAAQVKAATETTNNSNVVYNNNTINISADTSSGMEQVKQAFAAYGVTPS